MFLIIFYQGLIQIYERIVSNNIYKKTQNLYVIVIIFMWKVYSKYIILKMDYSFVLNKISVDDDKWVN